MNHAINAALVTGLLATTSLAGITNLFAGDTVEMHGITAAEDPTLVAGVLQDTVQQFVIADPAGEPLVGAFHSRAAQRMDTGELDFYWRITIDDGKTGEISSVIINGFEGWSVGVEYRVDSVGSIGPSDASRSVDDQFLGYHFNDPTLRFFDSHSFLARTEAFEYDFTGTAQINMTNGESITFATFAPRIPAPGAVSVLGIAALGTARRRRSKA
tara:strand:- start:184 stop:825 length:642 start_codon:yes stop_codon:yes gene_type:complete